MKLLFALCLLFALALPAAAAPVSVPLTLSLTPQPPPPFTATVSQPVTIAGVTYTMSGTLTFTPTATVAALPAGGANPVPASLAGLPEATRGPMLAGYRDAAGHWASLFHPGERIYLEGLGWGDKPGAVSVNTEACAVNEWSDAEIGIALPPGVGVGGALVAVRRPDGAYYQSRGFLVAKTP